MRFAYLIFGAAPLLPELPYGSVVLVALATIGVLLLKRTVDKIMEKVDLIPSKEWFEDVHEALKKVPDEKWLEDVREGLAKIPDPTRLQEHYRQGHDHANTLTLHTGQIVELQRRVGEIEHRLNGSKG